MYPRQQTAIPVANVVSTVRREITEKIEPESSRNRRERG